MALPFASVNDDTGPKKIMIPGLMNQLFSQGSSGTGYDYMEWVSNATPSQVMPTMIMPFSCRLTQITCRYLGTTAFTCALGDSWVVTMRRVEVGASPIIGNSEQVGEAMFTWDATLSGTYPSTTVTFATPYELEAGDEIAIVGTETATTGQLQDDSAEAQLCLVFEYE